MGYLTHSVYGRMPTTVVSPVYVSLKPDYERGVDHISASSYDPFAVTCSPAGYVEAEFLPGQHEDEGFYVLEIDVQPDTVTTFTILSI